MLNSQVGQTFERFLELPVAMVLVVMWLMGVVLEVTFVLALYLVGHWSVFALWYGV